MNDFPPINFEALADALLARAETLVAAWLSGGVKKGHEYVCAGLSGGPGTSCSINLVKGVWKDFATDEAGTDLISLYAAIHGLSDSKAAIQLAREEGLTDVANIRSGQGDAAPAAPRPAPVVVPSAPKQPEGWVAVTPVPDTAPAPTFRHQYRHASDIVHTAVYRIDGQLYGYVVRFKTSEGGKETLPHTWCTSARDGASRWHWKTWEAPRPLYFPAGFTPGGKTVILVEGEKKADILQQLLDAGAPGVYCVAGWPGGCKAWQKADWHWLQGCHVIAWPDHDSKRVPLTAKERNACADEAARDLAQAAKPYLPADEQPGMRAMLGIGQHLTQHHACQVQLVTVDVPVGTLPDGWDCADAIQTDGWSFDRVLQFLATAYALPSSDAADAATSETKKIDGPVVTEGGGSADSGKPMPWWLACFYDAVKGRWNISRKTVIMALRHDPDLQGVLGFNELSNTMEARRDWPFAHGKRGKITGATDLLLGDWLSKTYGLPAITRQALMEGMETVAFENPWHPVREWLTGLQWDGKARLDKWLIHVIGENPTTISPALAQYLAQVGRFWLIGMVKRVMEPGCKFDYCPVLEGRGGLGKSTLVETLASRSWYSDTPFDIGKGKESQEQVQGIWGYELGEMGQMGKAEINAVKAFISAQVDRYRPAYGRVVEEHPRQCVMVGTTNEATYLRDRTGNRRFWPVPVTKPILVQWLGERRDQLFAEAYAAYCNGDACIPSREDEERLFVPMQESRMIETAVTSELLHLLTRSPTATGIGAIVNELSDFVTLSQLCQALNTDAGKSTAGLESQIRSWMAQQGWIYKKKQIQGVRAPGWSRPPNWPQLDFSNEDSPANAGPSAPTTTAADDEPF